MASSAKEYSPVPEKRGFQKWVKLSPDDLPLIRPPKHHMVVQMTGGLTNLFKKIAEDKLARGNTDPNVPKKPNCQLELEKSDVVRISLVKFYTERTNTDDEKELVIGTDEDGQNSSSKDKEKKCSDGGEEKVNGEEESMEVDAAKKSNGEVEDGEPMETDSKEKDEEKSSDKKETDNDGEEKENIDKQSSKENNKEGDESKENKEDEDKNSKDEISDEGGGTDKSKSSASKEDGADGKEASSEEKKSDEEKESSTKDGEEKTTGDEAKKDSSKSDKEEAAEEESDEEEEEEEEETTEYTDEDGEFVPITGMPLLAGRYKYLQILGRGQSALIVKAEDTFCDNKLLAIKVLHRVYKPIGSQEADILLELHRADPYLHVPFARIKTQFLYGPHYCLVFDALSPTPLYTHYDQRDIRGASSLPYIRQLAVKLLTVMGFLHKQNVIHADLKPENILLGKESDLNSIMVVDFGNALRNTEEELSLYYSDFELQTLLYRAPEVIFGLRFSLEVDMWSLGCLLAECYIGKPLFMGKTKHDILSKMSKLLGPFPAEFGEGMCGEEFGEFIGRPLSRYQRMQNLAKRLNKCTNVQFLMLIERMLTYLPERRMVPAEAACHPFVAYISPFLYLTPTPGQLRYPTVVLDLSTYPFLPESVLDEEDEDAVRKTSRKRLLSLAHPIKAPVASSTSTSSSATAGSNTAGGAHNNNNIITTTTTSDSVMSINKQTKTVSVASTSSSQTPVSRSDVKETLKSMGLRCEDFTISVYSKEQAHAILRRQGVEVTNHTPGNGSGSRQQQQQRQQQMQYQQNQRGRNVRGASGGNSGQGFRSSVSVGKPPASRNMVNSRGSGGMSGGSARSMPASRQDDDDDDDDDCVILDPPENHHTNSRSQGAPPMAPKGQGRLPQQFQLMGTTVQVNRGAKRPYTGPQNAMPPKRSSRSMMGPYHPNQNYQPQQQYRQMQQQQRYGGSRQQRYQQQMMQQQQQYMDDYSDEDSGGENSVQDTLKRLKNYNISITCRRNEPVSRNMGGNRNMSSGGGRYMGGGSGNRQMSGNYHHGGNMHRNMGGNMMRSGGQHSSRGQNMMRGGMDNMMHHHHQQGGNMVRSDSDYDDEHPMDSEEDTEADMAKFLECEIGEDEGMGMGAMVEGDEELHFGDDDEDDDLGEIPPVQARAMARHHQQQQQHRNMQRQYAHNNQVMNSGSNREKGKSSHLSATKNTKNLTRGGSVVGANRKSNESKASVGDGEDGAGDTSIEEVVLSRDSEGEYDNDIMREEQQQRRRQRGNGNRRGADNDEEDEDGDHDVNTSSVAEIIEPENNRHDDDDDREDGGGDPEENPLGDDGDEEATMNNEGTDAAGEDASSLVDNLLERHLNAVCGEGEGSPKEGENAEGKSGDEKEEDDNAENNDKADGESKNRTGSKKRNSKENSRSGTPDNKNKSEAVTNNEDSQTMSPVNEDALLAGEDEGGDDAAAGTDKLLNDAADGKAENAVADKKQAESDALGGAEDDEIDEELEKELLGGEDAL